ncbi:hypothetical protein SHKM778_83050 [Streptomyces sp. KM77-8]|uniref:RDD domain-containing protein n=1 Tax=Streptomyces haneummycinicus TaxID=3074435 RepID=A0AAT9HW67_9ACTN
MPLLAESGRRTLARIIDMILVGAVVWLLTWPFGVSEYNVDGDNVNVGNSLAQSVIAAVLYVAYDTFMMSRTGQTLGKKWLHLRLANLADGSTPPPRPRSSAPWCCGCRSRSAAPAYGRSSRAAGASSTGPTNRACTTRRPRPWWSAPDDGRTRRRPARQDGRTGRRPARDDGPA